VKFSSREIGRTSSIKYAILSFQKCLNYSISGIQEGDFFFNCDNTKLKRSSKINFSVSENRWTVRGWSEIFLLITWTYFDIFGDFLKYLF